MRRKAKIQQETFDWLFVLNATRNGDQKAIKAFTRFQEIIKEIKLSEIERKQCLPEFRLACVNRINSLEKEKESLLKDFDIIKKKAKSYIETIRRKKREVNQQS